LEDLSNWIENKVTNRTSKVENLLAFKKVLKRLRINTPKEIITIGGTNGKGTLAELISQLSLKKGISVGTFTSPHIINFNERIKINGNEISDSLFLEALKKVEYIRKETELNFYQILSLAALEVFSKLNLELWILEIGLGGRLDPMNSIDPDISVITKVAIDHQEILGNTINKIAQEKSGILRRKKPVIYGETKVPKPILDKAKSLESPLFSPSRKNFEVKRNKVNFKINDEKFSFDRKNFNYPISSLFCLFYLAKLSKFKLIEELDQDFLDNFFITGRIMRLTENSLLDSSHNLDAVNFLKDYINTRFKSKKIIVYFSCSIEKDPKKLIKPFINKVDKIYLLETGHKRLLPAKKLKNLLNTVGDEKLFEIMSVKECVNRVNCIEDIRVLNLIYGSFYLTGEILKCFLETNGLNHSLSTFYK